MFNLFADNLLLRILWQIIVITEFIFWLFRRKVDGSARFGWVLYFGLAWGHHVCVHGASMVIVNDCLLEFVHEARIHFHFIVITWALPRSLSSNPTLRNYRAHRVPWRQRPSAIRSITRQTPTIRQLRWFLNHFHDLTGYWRFIHATLLLQNCFFTLPTLLSCIIIEPTATSNPNSSSSSSSIIISWR